ncbi:MAG TPA: glycosyltransferase [Candidatus Dormibacteraeota bacterium]|jgi:glycosyltransferase involved in cell wall biosynthesis|nr:glycosyltransferase [Candidatus Dormibacteraeota bacterium]
MKICLVTAFPPSGRQLNEYAFYIARELQRDPRINLTILADELDDYEFATDGNGNPLGTIRGELPGFEVVRCWKFNNLATPFRLLRTIRQIKPDVVWFNLVFSTFATPDHPVAAFAGLCVPALARGLGCYAHVTLHHILEHVDFAGAGVQQDGIFRLGSELATRMLLRANSVSVLLSAYQQTLLAKYSAQNVLLGTHGVFASRPSPPDLAKRGNPDHRILAIGHWGTYKRLDTLMEALPALLKRVPAARVIVAGANHHTKPGYWESIRDSQNGNPRIEFRGYVPEQEIPDLFRSSSIVVMPYDSATGSSGPAHQACEFGVPMVCADIADFRIMAADEEMAISFYKTGDAADLADKLAGILESPTDQRRMAEQNCSAAVRMTMPYVVRNYLRWFELAERKRALGASSEFQTFRRWSRDRSGSSGLRLFSGPNSLASATQGAGVVRIKSRIVEEGEIELEGEPGTE